IKNSGTGERIGFRKRRSTDKLTVHHWAVSTPLSVCRDVITRGPLLPSCTRRETPALEEFQFQRVGGSAYRVKPICTVKFVIWEQRANFRIQELLFNSGVTVRLRKRT
ncbi:hypothetical protein PISMIDRAFT_680826, partial [Pisolithus microcarpus 441]